MVDDRPAAHVWGPPLPHVDVFDRPSSARVYDYMLGGAAHGAIDRELGREMILAEPRAVSMARENRSLLRRSVSYLVSQGIDQFLDLGSGIPTMGNVHEVARRLDHNAHVAYVDIDPIAVTHGELVLNGVEGVTSSRCDLRDPDAVIAADGVAEVLDLSRPVGLLMFSVLQHVSDADDPRGIVARYLSWLAPGSALAISHLSADDPGVDMRALRTLTAAYPRGELTLRSLDEVRDLFSGVDLVDPGVTWAARWRPEPPVRPGPAREVSTGHRAGVGFLYGRPGHRPA